MVVEHYLSKHPGRNVQAESEEARNLIRERLAEGYRVVDLCSAIDGNHGDKWCQDSGNTKITQIFKNSGQVDKFTDLDVRRGRAQRSHQEPSEFDKQLADALKKQREAGHGDEA